MEASSLTERTAEIYARYVKPLSVAERLELLATVAQDLATENTAARTKPKRSILELAGLGKEIWEGIDAQEYVNQLRREWDTRP